MPMYEYTCRKCDHTFETLVFGDESVACPECQSSKLERLLSVPAAPKSGSTLPMTCDPSTPPCGTGCRKLM
jgi:putative FmdB family regulatory protein